MKFTMTHIEAEISIFQNLFDLEIRSETFMIIDNIVWIQYHHCSNFSFRTKA